MSSSSEGHPHPTTSGPLSFSRRRLLGVGVGVVGVGALGVGATVYGLVASEDPAPNLKSLSVGEAAFIAAMIDALFPPGNALGVAGSDVDVVGPIDEWLSEMGAHERRVVGVLLHMFDLWPRLSAVSTARFSTLDRARRIEMLRAFDESAVETRRALGQLLRALVCLPFFEDVRVQAGIGMSWGCEVPT